MTTLVEARRVESGVWVLGEGAANPPPHRLGGLGIVSLPSWVWGRAPPQRKSNLVHFHENQLTKFR